MHAIIRIDSNFPRQGREKIVKSQVHGSDVTLSRNSCKRLIVKLKDLFSDKEKIIISPPLNFSGMVTIPFWIIWDWDNSDFKFRMFDSIWFLPGEKYDLPFDVPEPSRNLPEIYVVSDGASERAARSLVAEARRKEAHFSLAEKELETELDQLHDLVELIPRRPTHIRGAIAIVRKLIADRPGLIQLVAGSYNADLSIFSNASYPPPPQYEISGELLARTTLTAPGAFRLQLMRGFRFKTDLDCWLSDRSTILSGRRISNRDFIKSIADKIGAHNDLRERETVETLMLRSGGKNEAHTSLESYVSDLSISTGSLGARLLAQIGYFEEKTASNPFTSV